MRGLCSGKGFLFADRGEKALKGVGWALKDVMRGDSERVLAYVKELRRRGVAATITLYAMRDLRGREREEVLEVRRRDDLPSRAP